MQAKSTTKTGSSTSRWGYRVLLVSGLLNLLLLGAIGNHRWHRSHSIDEGGPQPSEPENRSKSPRNARTHRVNVATDGSSSIWNGISSTNFLLYAEHLRQVGCPEKTVCAIIRPALARWYEGQRTEWESTHASASSNFWATGKRRREIRAETAQFHAALRKARETIQQSLGCPITDAYRQESVEDFLVFGFLSQEQLKGVEALLIRASQKIEEWNDKGWGPGANSNHPPRNGADYSRLKKEAQEFDRELSGLLSPNELEELTARYYCFERGYLAQTNSLTTEGMTSAEFRSLMLLCARTEHFSMAELNPYWTVLEESPADSSRTPSQHDLVTLLGGSRAYEVGRAIDPLYGGTKTTLSNFNVPESVSDEGYRQLMEARVQAGNWRSLFSTDPTAARQGIRELRASLRQQFGVLFKEVPEEARKMVLDSWVDAQLLEAWNNGGVP